MENNNVKNGEILFIYEGKLTNPNGDIDDENRPRMDYDTFTNLVSDVRLKRYIRDYLQERGYPVFINHGYVTTASERLNKSLNEDGKIDILYDPSKRFNYVSDKFIDIRLFGCMIPIQKPKDTDRESGDSIRIVGPIQFSWGYSLNKVELLNSYSITGGFSSSEGNKMNSIGKDYRLYYSLLGFYGVVSGERARKVGLNENDMKLFDEAMIKSIPTQASRSKINQNPVFYMRTESDNGFLGDLRDYVTFNVKNNFIRSINDYSLDLSKLNKILQNKSVKIGKLFIHDLLNIENGKDELLNLYGNGKD